MNRCPSTGSLDRRDHARAVAEGFAFVCGVCHSVCVCLVHKLCVFMKVYVVCTHVLYCHNILLFRETKLFPTLGHCFLMNHYLMMATLTCPTGSDNCNLSV